MQITPLSTQQKMFRVGCKFDKNFRRDTEDCCFIMNMHVFPWHMIKDGVIRRLCFDTHIIEQCNRGPVNVFEVI